MLRNPVIASAETPEGEVGLLHAIARPRDTSDAVSRTTRTKRCTGAPIIGRAGGARRVRRSVPRLTKPVIGIAVLSLLHLAVSNLSATRARNAASTGWTAPCCATSREPLADGRSCR